MVAAAHINRITPATAVEAHYRNVRGASIPRPGRYATTWELDSSQLLSSPALSQVPHPFRRVRVSPSPNGSR